jgi:hypothetical protein
VAEDDAAESPPDFADDEESAGADESLPGFGEDAGELGELPLRLSVR